MHMDHYSLNMREVREREQAREYNTHTGGSYLFMRVNLQYARARGYSYRVNISG